MILSFRQSSRLIHPAKLAQINSIASCFCECRFLQFHDAANVWPVFGNDAGCRAHANRLPGDAMLTGARFNFHRRTRTRTSTACSPLLASISSCDELRCRMRSSQSSIQSSRSCLSPFPGALHIESCAGNAMFALPLSCQRQSPAPALSSIT